MKIRWKPLLFCLAIPLIIGGIAAILTQSSMETFEHLQKPVLSPPGWLFPVVWTLLFICMGGASYLCLTSGGPQTKIQNALTFYAIQLIFNFFWTLIFFNLDAYLIAFLWLVVLWILILLTTLKFYNLSRPAGLLMLPYLLWVTFAGYLNLSIYMLN